MWWVVGIGALAALTACKQEIPLPPPSERSNVAVTLPPTPTLAVKPYERLHPDGVLTVEGLMRNRDEFLGKVVKVRGVVSELTHCPTPPPAEPVLDDKGVEVPQPPPRPPRTCDPPPHAILVDKGREAPRELLVYGSMYSAIEHFEVGAEATVEGTFDIVSRDGVFLRQAGLLTTPDIIPDIPIDPPEEDLP